MAGGLRCRPGGIETLLDIIDDPQQRRALEADLIRQGLRLRWFGVGDPDYTWGDLAAVVFTADKDSALAAELLGEKADWGLTEQLLAAIADNITLFRHSFAKKGTKLPKLITDQFRDIHRAPGERVERVERDLNERDISGTITGAVTSTADIAHQLGWAD